MFYQDELTTIYCGDSKELVDTLPKEYCLVSDVPYGISLATNYKTRKRGALAECNDFAPIHNDDKPFDPTPLLGFKKIALFGANYYASKLPDTASWLVWDKLDGLKSKREIGFNDNADCELIWTNTGKPMRILHHRWMGAMKGSEKRDKRVHPTQKPVELMIQVIKYLGIGGGRCDIRPVYGFRCNNLSGV